MESEIATEEFQALTRCETIIEAGLHTFWEVGLALTEVRDKRLWQGQYENFNDYLANRWKMKPTYAGQLMLAAGIRAELTHLQCNDSQTEENRKSRFPLPDSVAGACALKSLDTEEKIQILEQLQKQELPATRQNIRQVLEELHPTPPKTAKLSYGILRNSITALVKQSEFLNAIPRERIEEIFPSPETRECAVDTLTRLVELLTLPENV